MLHAQSWPRLPPDDAADKHTMSGKKVYAVAAGRKSGMYDTWGEAQAQTDKYSHNAHKSFSTRREAEGYLATQWGAREAAAPAPAPAPIERSGAEQAAIRRYYGKR